MEETIKKSKNSSLSSKIETREKDDLFLEMSAKTNAINSTFAYIEFDLKGNILSANDIFLDAMGYSLDEIEGEHHRIFVSTSYSKSADYKKFWKDLREGQPKTGEFDRIGKDGNVVWLQASYTPVTDHNGEITKIIKLATDITEQKRTTSDFSSQIEAINKSNAVIEFAMDGTIITANDNFLDTFDYTLDEIKGKHHRIFCDHKTASSIEYKQFWENLNNGIFDTGEYLRFGKKGKEVWIQASYNPVLNLEGDPYKVVKYASDITKQKEVEKETQEANEKLRATEEELRQNMEEMSSIQEQLTKRELTEKYEKILGGCADAIILTNEEGIISYINNSVLSMTGYEAGELLGENIAKLFEVYQLERQPQRGYLSTISTKGKEDKVLLKNGKKLSVYLSVSMAETSEGNVYAGFIKDLTELKAKENYYEQILNAIPQPIFVTDKDMRWTFLNKSVATSFNLDAQETKKMIGRDCCTIDVEICKTEDCAIAKLKKGDPKTEFNFKGRHYKVHSAHIFDMEGERNGFIEVINDFTEYQQILRDSQAATEQVRAQEEELRQNMEEIKATQEEMERKQIEMDGQMNAIDSTSAFVEYTLDGTINKANDLFLRTMKYSLGEVRGKHHQIFCEVEYANSRSYDNFWNDLKNGKPQSGEFKRINKIGEEIWLLANYTPVVNTSGKVIKVIELATDITENKLKNANFEGQLNAVNRSYAVIEFDMQGNVLDANQNFLNSLNYGINEIKGAHHRMFCEQEYINSNAYRIFWEDLIAGKFSSGTFKRLGKGGKEVYIQATYNPIFDLNGNPFKVVEYAIDITEFTVALNEVSRFIGELKQGNFDAELTIQADGNVGQMIEDNLSLRQTLKEIIGEINHVVREAGEKGNLNARLNIENAHGAWRGLIDSMNTLLQSVAEPMLEFDTIITQMAGGDLTNKFEMQAHGDIKNMADALNTAISNLNHLLRNIESSAEVVADSTGQMLKKSEDINRSAAEVSSAITQMAQGAQDQANQTDASSRLVNQVKASAEEMEHKAGIINQTAEEGKRNSETGLKTMKSLVENMDSISSSANQTSDSITVLTERAEEIGRTLNVITDIAAQTNLLALNAAIEAARAGDAGRGFAVVADEIRKLAENSRNSAVEIEKIISDVQKDTQAASKAIEAMGLSVNNGNKATKEAEGIFSEISKSSENTFNFSEEIKKSSVLQKDAIASVVSNMEQVVIVAEQTAAGSQQVAGSAQKLNINMTDITSSSDKLSNIASELKEGVKKFKLS